MPPVALVGAKVGEGPSLIVLHGLFGSAGNWHAMTRRLSAGRTVHALDLRNHGASPWAARMSYPDMAEDVLGYIKARSLARPAVLGHSMGGKAAMVAALSAPERIARLIVVDIAPVRYRHGFAPLVDALAALDLDGIGRRTDADEQLADAVPDPAIRGFLLQNLVLREGRYVWRINLKAIAAGQSDLWDFPDLGPSARFDGPTLFIAGKSSDHVRPDHRPAIERYFPKAEIVQIPNAGHWVHADQPDAFLAEVDRFMRRSAAG